MEMKSAEHLAGSGPRAAQWLCQPSNSGLMIIIRLAPSVDTYLLIARCGWPCTSLRQTLAEQCAQRRLETTQPCVSSSWKGRKLLTVPREEARRWKSIRRRKDLLFLGSVFHLGKPFLFHQKVPDLAAAPAARDTRPRWHNQSQALRQGWQWFSDVPREQGEAGPGPRAEGYLRRAIYLRQRSCESQSGRKGRGACLPACNGAGPAEVNGWMLKGETSSETGTEKSFHSYFWC